MYRQKNNPYEFRKSLPPLRFVGIANIGKIFKSTKKADKISAITSISMAQFKTNLC